MRIRTCTRQTCAALAHELDAGAVDPAAIETRHADAAAGALRVVRDYA